MVSKRGKFIPGLTGTFSAANRVITHLSNGPQTLGEIRKFLKESRVEISKDGVIKFLNKYEKKGIIKKDYRGKQFPVYYLSKKGLQDVGIRADTFKHEALSTCLNNLEIPEERKEQLIVLKKIVDIIGLYSFVAYLYGFNFDGISEQFSEKHMIWTGNIGVIDEILVSLEDIMMNFWDESKKEALTPIVSSYGPTIMKWGEEENAISKQVAQKVKKMLHTLYPKEMKMFDDIYQQLDERIKDYNEFVKITLSENTR